MVFECVQMVDSDSGDDADVGFEEFARAQDMAGVGKRGFQDYVFGFVVDLHQVIVVAAQAVSALKGEHDRPFLLQHLGNHFLGGRFSARSRHCHYFDVEKPAVVSRKIKVSRLNVGNIIDFVLGKGIFD